MFILLLSILVAMVIVVFAVQNAVAVPVQFLLWSADLPLVLVIFCSVFAGALLMFCLALWRQLKSQIKRKSPGEISLKKNTVAGPIDLSGTQGASVAQNASVTQNTSAAQNGSGAQNPEKAEINGK